MDFSFTATALSARLSTARADGAFFLHRPPFSTRTHGRRTEAKKSPCPPLWAGLVCERRRALAHSATSALLHPVFPSAGLPPVHIKKPLPSGKSDSFLAAVVRPVELLGSRPLRGPRTLAADYPAVAARARGSQRAW